MTPDELRAHALAYVERSTREQGKPYHVTDPGTLARLAVILAPQVRARRRIRRARLERAA